ncbi:putative WRKY transcription factor 70 [Prunus yedoensis var. nudiflora]|uniref:Putative WRKY transcription factor 70 n=1 Tax=Prunus yedoensis var. nudiflora TaxID=2094558 RepID=A0A314YDZ0_PRUYE|nr:putative WRKY transcription factor 70 [Prunus yedoensis var. nudiflora]
MGSNHKRLIKELVEGKKTATELQMLLHKPFGDHGSASAEELVVKIMTSFTESLSVLAAEKKNPADGHEDHQSGAFGEVYQIKPEPSHSHCDDRSSGDSGESRKGQGSKDRRGCYKRRKTSQSWTTVSPAIEDGRAWRKYGQKEILNAPYPRAYFRCTRKYDQHCKATKQVQQVQENPRLYQTTYIGQHTCKSMVLPQMILGIGSSDPWESQTVSSESGTPNKQNHDLLGSSAMPIVKQEEYKEGTPTPSDLTDNLSSLETNNLWSDFKDDFALCDPAAMCVSTKMGSDNDDVVSNMYLDLDFVDKSIDFEGDFNFDEVEFPKNSL